MELVKKNKKSIIVASMILVALFICYFIGQNFVLPNRMKSAGFTDADGKVPSYSILENFNTFALGEQKAADVPGSLSINQIDFNKDNSGIPDEWLGKCIFMLPETSFAKRMKIEGNYNTIDFEYGIYPDMSADVCDGASVVVELYLNEEDGPVVHEEFKAIAESGLKRASVDISKYQGQEATIAISCNAGGNENEDGDWIMIKYPVIK